MQAVFEGTILMVLLFTAIGYDVQPKNVAGSGLDQIFGNQTRMSKSDRRLERMMTGKAPKKPKLDPPVSLIISEINIDNPAGSNTQFVEIEIVRKKLPGRQKSNVLQGFFLLVITSNPLQLVLSVHLGVIQNIDPFKTFLVIGTTNVNNVDIDVNAHHIHNIYKNSQGADLFPKTDIAPVGIVIAYQPERDGFIDLGLFKSPDGKYLPTVLSSHEHKMQLIQFLTKDAAVVCSKCAVNRCEFFDTLFPMYQDSTQQYILRDWDSFASTNDHSLNRCAESKNPFLIDSYLVGKVTPGQVNDCSGRRLVLEQVIDEFIPQTANDYTASTVAGCSAEFNSVPSAKYETVSQANFREILERYSVSPLNKCPYKVGQSAAPESSEQAVQISEESRKGLEHKFDVSWLSQCKAYLPKQGVALGYSQVMAWVHVHTTPGQCRFYCFYCVKFFKDGFRVDIRHKKDIQTEYGYFSSNPSKNQAQLIAHYADEVHKRAFNYVNSLKTAQTAKEWESIHQAQEEMDISFYRPTINVMQFTYAEIMSDISFSKHPYFMSTLAKLGVDVGTIQHSEKASRAIMQVYATSFQKRLLQSLVDEDAYFTIIADGTHYRNTPYLVVLLQTFHKLTPVVYFYCLIPLESEKGSTMVNHLKTRVQNDDHVHNGFESWFKTHLICQASYSASNMIGSHNSFYSHLQTYVGHKIGLVRCFAHALQLAVKRSMQIITFEDKENQVTRKYFNTFGSTNNLIFTFYFSRGSKRFNHLAELAQELGLHLVRMKYFFDVRWASSHKAAMTALRQDWDLLREDLALIIADENSFDQKSRETAKFLLSKIDDKAFIVTLCELLDVLDIYSQISLQFQKQDGVMLEKAEVIRQGLRDLAGQKLKPGKHLAGFLAQCSCTDICEEGSCGLAEYDSCEHIQRNGKEIPSNDPEAIKLSEHRDKLYESLAVEIKKYFPLDLLESYSIFNPKYFKFRCPNEGERESTCAELSSCYNFFRTDMKIKDPVKMLDNICTFYQFEETDCVGLKQEWPILLASITVNDFLINYSLDQPSKFWPLALSQSNVQWKSHSKRIIEYVLVSSTSSSAAERAFSVISSIQDKERAALTSDNLEMITRIKMNGPEDVSKIDVVGYTKEFLKHHMRVDEVVNPGGRTPNPEKMTTLYKTTDIF